MYTVTAMLPLSCEARTVSPLASSGCRIDAVPAAGVDGTRSRPPATGPAVPRWSPAAQGQRTRAAWSRDPCPGAASVPAPRAWRATRHGVPDGALALAQVPLAGVGQHGDD